MRESNLPPTFDTTKMNNVSQKMVHLLFTTLGQTVKLASYHTYRKRKIKAREY